MSLSLLVVLGGLSTVGILTRREADSGSSAPKQHSEAPVDQERDLPAAVAVAAPAHDGSAPKAAAQATPQPSAKGKPPRPLPSDYDELTDGFEKAPSDNAAMLSSRWGIQVYIPSADAWSASSQTHGKRPSAGTLEKTVSTFAQALLAYPEGFIEAARFERLLVVESFHHKGVRAGMIGMGPYHALTGTATQLRAVHHELFHLVDYQSLGKPPREQAWLALNPREFRYRGSGREVLRNHDGTKASLTALTADTPGFISNYAQADGSEDRAELFAALMTNYAFVMERCTVDPVLNAKVAFLKEMLVGMTSTMNEDFWKTVRSTSN